jgi:hypothetical protein
MAGGCGLSHQCPGEPELGARETAAGVHWTAAGENIGEGGPVADNTAAIAKMAVALTQDMLNEKPPDDGHRRNILSSSFTHIGIAVVRDSSGTVWLTQDFSNSPPQPVQLASPASQPASQPGPVPATAMLIAAASLSRPVPQLPPICHRLPSRLPHGPLKTQLHRVGGDRNRRNATLLRL